MKSAAAPVASRMVFRMMASSDVMAITKWSIQAPSSKESPAEAGQGMKKQQF
jgi:hypothetical protein